MGVGPPSACLLVHVFDLGHVLGLVAAVVLLDHGLLGVRGALERVHDEPAALAVLNVRPDLSDDLGGTVAVQVIVLDL